MGRPVARLTDMHSCPLVDGPKPHVGGPIIGNCYPMVLAGDLPVATTGSLAQCNGPTDTVVQGSPLVLVNSKPLSRMGDATTHGGVITVGLPSVLVGDMGGPAQALALEAAAVAARPFCEL